jgi:hypothetical protein
MSIDIDNVEFGVTATGFRTKTQLAIKNSILLGLRQHFGSDVATSPGDPMTKFVETFASEQAAGWQQLEIFHNETSVKSASGQRQDDHAEARGITRKADTPAHTLIRFERAKNEVVAITGYDGSTEPVPGPADTVGSPDADVEFYVDVSITMPNPFIFTRAKGTLIDELSKQVGYEDFFSAQSVIEVRQFPGPVVFTPGVNYTVYTADDD